VETSEGRIIPSLVIADDYGVHTRSVGSEITVASSQVVNEKIEKIDDRTDYLTRTSR